MKRLNKLTAVLLLIVFTFIIAGCQNGGTAPSDSKQVNDSGKIRIAMITKAMDSEFWMDMKRGADTASEELGIELVVLAPDTETNVERQFKIIEDCISAKYDAIVVAPTDTDGVVPVLQAAVDKGIKVFAIDTNFELEGKSGFIGTDNIQIGKTAAEKMHELLNGQEGAKVAMITGVPGVQTMRDRADGFKNNLLDSLKLVDEQPADSDSGKAMNVMENMLTTHNDLAGVYILNTTMTTGAIQAIGNYGSKAYVISVDISSDNLKFTKDGKIAGFISQDSYGIGYESIHNAVKAVNGETYQENVYVEAQWVDQSNVDEISAKREENLQQK